MRRRYIFPGAILVLFCSLPVYSADVRIKIAVMELQALSGYEQGEAAQLTELLKADLINNTRFFVTEQDSLSTDEAERYAGCTEINCAVEIGSLLETEYVLVGTVGKIGGDTAFSISLVNVLTEERVLAEDYVVTGDKVIDEIHEIARQVTNSAVLITRVDIEDIKGYIRREQFDKANRYLNFYIERNGGNEDEVKQLETVITQRLSEIRYDQAKEMLDNSLFTEANMLIEEALLLDPDNLIYIDLKEQIEIKETTQTETDKARLIGEIEKYLDQQDYKTANTLMLILLRQYPKEDPTIIRLKNEIKTGITASEKYEEAKRALDNKEFERARTAINVSVRLNPEEKRYAEFVEELDAEETEYNASRAVWEQYRTELKRIDPLYLFVVKKNVSSFFNLTITATTVSYREGTTLEAKGCTFPGIELSFLYHVWEPFSLPFDFTDIYVTVNGNIGFGRFADETISSVDSPSHSVSYASIDDYTLFYTDINGGAGLTAVVFAYYLGLGIEVSTGILSENTEREIAVLEEQRSYRETYYTLGLGFDIWFGWHATETLELFSKVRFSYPLWLGIDHSLEKIRKSQFSIGMGYSFF